MVALLVFRFNQPLEQAWRFTYREFASMVQVYQPKSGFNYRWDSDKLSDFERHLKSMGIKL